MKNLGRIIAACSLTMILLAAFKADTLPALFTDRLNRAQMVFTPPENYLEVPVKANQQMHYEVAFRSPDSIIEVRYAIVPLDSIFIQFEQMKKEGSVMAIGPNKFYSTSFFSIVMNISDRKTQPNMQSFPPEAVKKEFNADWGASVFCNVNDDFGKGYKHCMAVAIHKDNMADAYIFYLTNDVTQLSRLMSPIFYALKFKKE